MFTPLLVPHQVWMYNIVSSLLLPLGVSLALGVMQHASQATITNAHKFVLAKTFAWMGLIVVLGAIRDIIEVD